MMIKFFTFLMALVIIGSLISMNYFISEPAEALVCTIGLGILGVFIGGLIFAIVGVLFGIVFDIMLIPVYIIVIIIAVIILLVLGIIALLILLSIAVFLIILSIIAVPILLFLGVVSILIISGIAALPILMSIAAVSIIFIIGFILQLLGIPVFSILFSLLQMGGHLILIPLSFLRPLVNGISNFIQSIGKIETSSKIESSGVVL